MAKKKSRRERMAEAALQNTKPAVQAEAPAEEPAPKAEPSKPKAPPVKPAPTRSQPIERWKTWAIPVLMLGFFVLTGLTGGNAAKGVGLVAALAAIGSCLYRIAYVRDRMTLPTLAVSLWMLVNGLSMIYAVSGTFALRAFLNLVTGYGVLLLMLAWSRKGQDTGRAAASVLTGGTAIASLLSIDLLSTRLLADPVLAFMNALAGGSALDSTGVEVGVRMVSIYENPNAFAGVAGLAVLLGLGLASSSLRANERRFHQACLFINALAFVLAFSMGASGMIAVSFLVLLLLEARERKAGLFLLMVETLVLTLLCAFPIFITAFDKWDGIQPVPLLCTAAGAVGLCLADQFVGQKLTAALADKGKALAAAVVAIVAALGVFAVAAFTMTGSADLSDATLRRAAYPAPGTYTMDVSGSSKDAELGPDSFQVTIESQNQQDTMMHTSTVLYRGSAQGATFTVPEDSQVVYFNFRSKGGEPRTLASANYSGENGSGALKLGYKLLPGFIANRLQGLKANQNAIQRTVFFADGMKLFRRSPVIGLGIGAFENAILGVQSFFYETKYAHNHYVETLVTTGIVGIVVFVGMLAILAAALWKNLRKKEEADPLAPALAAALLFIAAHAVVEIVLSFCFYLPMAFGVLGLICLCCGDDLPLPGANGKVRSGLVGGICALLAVFAVLLYLNISAARMISQRNYRDPFEGLDKAAKMDRFEWTTYSLSYVYAIKQAEIAEPGSTDPAILARADEHAVKLATIDSNTIPRHLAEYYMVTGRPEEGMAMLDKYVDYTTADSRTWQQAFAILQAYFDADQPVFKEEVLKLADQMDTWNEEHMGTIQLDEMTALFVGAIRHME